MAVTGAASPSTAQPTTASQQFNEGLAPFVLGLVLGLLVALIGMLVVLEEKAATVRAVEEKYGIGVRLPRVEQRD